MFISKKISFLFLSLIITFNVLCADDVLSEISEQNLSSPTFSLLRDETGTILQNDYFEFIRMSILEQPEYSHSISSVEEKNMLFNL